jgi:hypothetical protein
MSFAAKETATAFRWYRAFMKHKQTPTQKDPSSRYTNFSLLHVWEKFDCQTQLLQREAIIPLMKWNPELFDSDVDRFGSVHFDIKKPVGTTSQ